MARLLTASRTVWDTCVASGLVPIELKFDFGDDAFEIEHCGCVVVDAGTEDTYVGLAAGYALARGVQVIWLSHSIRGA